MENQGVSKKRIGDIRYAFNPYATKNPIYSPTFDDEVSSFHHRLSGYQSTPLYSMPTLAKALGVGQLLIKDESQRFDFNAFKVLGPSYAMYRLIQQIWDEKSDQPFPHDAFPNIDLTPVIGSLTFTTATAGNHGRAVAWTARKLGQQAHIFVPGFTAAARIEALEKAGATVTVVDGHYDDTVAFAQKKAKEHDWLMVADIAYDDYTQIPTWIMSGYTTIFREVDQQCEAQGINRLDTVLLQCGVGGLAGAGVDYYVRKHRTQRPQLISVEPAKADCFLESILNDGILTTARGSQDSIMVGINCGTPSTVAWPVMRAAVDFFLAVDDSYALEAMSTLYHAHGDDPRIVAGESGAAGMAGLLAMATHPDLQQARQKMRLGAEDTVLIINTEGATDPRSFSAATARHT